MADRSVDCRAVGEEVELHSDDLRMDNTCALKSTPDGVIRWY